MEGDEGKIRKLKKKKRLSLAVIATLLVCFPVNVFAGTWQQKGDKWYYFQDETMVKSTWVQRGVDKYYIKSDGTMAAGVFMKDKENTYYFQKDGKMATGYQILNGKNYYFSDEGVMMDEDQAAAVEFSKKAASSRAAAQASAANDSKKSEDAEEEDDTQKGLTGMSVTKTENGTLISEDTDENRITKFPNGKSSLKRMLQIAMEPVGSTLYIWGGGWSGGDQSRIGTNPRWDWFFGQQNSAYNFNNYLYAYGNGLDCSGYVGWTIYNNLNSVNGRQAFTVMSKDTARNYASRGWGGYTPSSQVQDYRAGDIMSSTCSDCRHVWMVVGQCRDGSVVLLHSTPPGGVQLSGTVSSSGNQNSEAAYLAASYMSKYYPSWYAKYGTQCKNSSFLTHYSRMRWDVSGNRVMSDPDNYRNLSASQILADLFSGQEKAGVNQ